MYPKLATKCLEKEESIKYSMIEYEVFTRVISVERHFSLMLLVPTVQVINKSEANFFAKSSGTLLKINRQKRSYVLVNP